MVLRPVKAICAPVLKRVNPIFSCARCDYQWACSEAVRSEGLLVFAESDALRPRCASHAQTTLCLCVIFALPDSGKFVAQTCCMPMLAAILTRRSVEGTHARAHAQDRDKSLLSQLQKLKTEKKDIEEDVRQLVLIMEDRRAELTKQREAYEQVLTPA